MDWRRLLDRFDDHWEVLLAQIVLYRFAFPGERSRVPDRVLRELLRRVRQDMSEGDADERVCRGTLLSKTQYRHVLAHLGYEDGGRRAEGEGIGDGARVPAGRDG